MMSAYNQTKRIMIVGSRSCQDAVSDALKLPLQANIVFDCHFVPFDELFNTIFEDGFLTRPPSTWSKARIGDFHRVPRADLALIEQYSAGAEREGKRFVTMVNPATIANPAAIGWAGHKFDLSQLEWQVSASEFDINSNSPNTAVRSPSNSTILSDDYIDSWQMVFVFEHPLDSVTNIYRDIKEGFNKTRIGPEEMVPLLHLETSLEWMVSLLCLANTKSLAGFGPKPLIFHKGDFEHDEHGVIGQLCETLGLEKPARPPQEMIGQCREHVRAAAKEVSEEMARHRCDFFDGRLSEYHARVHKKHKKWKVEFGPHAAALLKKRAKDELQLYDIITDIYKQ